MKLSPKLNILIWRKRKTWLGTCPISSLSFNSCVGTLSTAVKGFSFINTLQNFCINWLNENLTATDFVKDLLHSRHKTIKGRNVSLWILSHTVRLWPTHLKRTNHINTLLYLASHSSVLSLDSFEYPLDLSFTCIHSWLSSLPLPPSNLILLTKRLPADPSMLTWIWKFRILAVVLHSRAIKQVETPAAIKPSDGMPW